MGTLTLLSIQDPSYLANYVRIVVLVPDLRRVFFYRATRFLHHSTNIKLVPLLNLYKGHIRTPESIEMQ
jgi:hypothetical protein